MTIAAAVFVVAAFLALARRFRVAALAKATVEVARQGFITLKNPALTDVDRETAVRAHAVRMLGLALRITFASAAAVLIPLGVVAALDAMGAVDFEAVIGRTLSPAFLLVGLLLAVGAALLPRRRAP